MARLECEVRLWRRVGAVTLLLVALLLLAAARAVDPGGFDEEGFVVRDPRDGRELFRVLVTGSGRPLVAMYDVDGYQPIGMRIDPDGASVVRLSGNPGTGVMLQDRQARVRARFELDERGDAFLVIFDQEGRQVWRAP